MTFTRACGLADLPDGKPEPVTVDEDGVALHVDGVDRDRLERRERGGLAGAQVEHRPVQPALDLAVGDLTLGERDGGVAALVLQCEHLVAVTGDGDVVRPDGHGERLVRGDVGEGTRTLEAHTSSLRTFLASSASTVVSSRSSIDGTPTLRIRSLKKPWTTSRCASFSEIPRDWR